MELTFGFACHGAGRVMGRAEAKRKFRGEVLEKQLAEQGIYVRATHPSMLAEEAPEVYKSSRKWLMWFMISILPVRWSG